MTDWLRLAINGAASNSVLLLAIGFVTWRVGRIEHKLDSFITRREIEIERQAAEKEHAAIRREINGVTRRIDART